MSAPEEVHKEAHGTQSDAMRAAVDKAWDMAMERAAEIAGTYMRVDWQGDGDGGKYGAGYENAAEEIRGEILKAKN